MAFVANDTTQTDELQKIKPCKELESFIHFYWELKGSEFETQRERVFPDGCAGIVMNLGNACLTDNGVVSNRV